MRLSAIFLPVLICAGSISAAFGQSFPSKPIRLIVPSPAGGAADVIARIVMPVAQKHLGQQIVIEPEGGAASIPGTARASKSPADGYTWLFGHVGTQVVNPYLFSNLPYDPTKDFVEVARLAAQALILAVPATSTAKNVKEFVDLAKAGKATAYASPGPGTSAHLSASRLAGVSDIQLRHIPFPSAPQAVLSLGRGEVDAMFFAYAGFLPQLEAGKLRLLGIATQERSAFLPDLPTMREQGYDVLITSWYGIFMPAGTPPEAVAKAADALNKAMADPEVIKALNAGGTDAFPTKSPEDFTAFVKSERERYKAVIEASGVQKK
jgi:tripartite-type tricarboxylate transporter receptor subunit TctC